MRLPTQVLLTCVAALITGCGHSLGDPPAPIPRPAEVMDFSTLYGENCAACHGANGEDGPAIDLANPEYQALVDDATLRKWISGGMPGTEMPAFAQSAGGMLTDAQVDALIAGMRKRWSQPNVFAGATPPPYAQPRDGDANDGAQSYQSRCAPCHASSPQQITSSDYLTIVGDQALRSIIIAGRPDIGQPDWRHLSLAGKTAMVPSAQEIDNIVAYLASLRDPAYAANDAPKQPDATASKGEMNP